MVVGAPVSAIRSFLTKAPAASVAPAPWLGIRGETDAGGSVRGVKVMAVAPQSPAEKAGLKPSADVIAAVDGQPIDSPENALTAPERSMPRASTRKRMAAADGPGVCAPSSRRLA